jgi:hypothetical protein
MRNVSVPIDGFSAIEVRFDGVDVDINRFDVNLSQTGEFVDAKISPPFKGKFSIHVAGDPQLLFSRFTIKVDHLRVRVGVRAPYLELGSPEYDAVGDVHINPTERTNALATSGVIEEHLARLEGALAFVMPKRVMSSAFATFSSIDLTKHFTALDIRGSWDLTLVSGGLVIHAADGIFIKENNGCPTHDSLPGFGVDPGSRVVGNPGEYSWPYTPIRVPGPSVHNADNRNNGLVSLYAPLPVWEARFGKAMPAVTYHEAGNGTLGYDLTLTAGLKYAGLTIDPSRNGIVVDLTIDTRGFLYATFDVPCVGRVDIAYSRFSVPQSSVSILVSFVLEAEGKLLLQASVDRLDIGTCVAQVDVFGKYAAAAGGEAHIIGLIADNILKRVIEHNVPIKLRDAIKQEVNSKNFQLLDLEELAQYTDMSRFTHVSYSGSPASVLVGLLSAG